MDEPVSLDRAITSVATASPSRMVTTSTRRTISQISLVSIWLKVVCFDINRL